MIATPKAASSGPVLPAARIAALALALAGGAPGLPADESAGKPGAYQKWAEEDVAYLITPEERAAYNRLKTAQQCEGFIEQFWKRRDPTPDTAANEFKAEHYRRISWANQRFAGEIPGWRTDRGRVYIVFGPPDEIESRVEFEIWRYRHIEGRGSNVEFEFDGQRHLRREPRVRT